MWENTLNQESLSQDLQFDATKLPKRLQIDVLFTKQKHYFCNEVIKQWKHKAD